MLSPKTLAYCFLTANLALARTSGAALTSYCPLAGVHREIDEGSHDVLRMLRLLQSARLAAWYAGWDAYLRSRPDHILTLAIVGLLLMTVLRRRVRVAD